MTVDVIGAADNGTVSITVTGGLVSVIADGDGSDIVTAPAGVVEITPPEAGAPITASPDGPVDTGATGLQGPPGPAGPPGDANLVGHATYVQAAQPAGPGPYLWVQTTAAGEPVTIWIDDGT